MPFEIHVIKDFYVAGKIIYFHLFLTKRDAPVLSISFYLMCCNRKFFSFFFNLQSSMQNYVMAIQFHLLCFFSPPVFIVKMWLAIARDLTVSRVSQLADILATECFFFFTLSQISVFCCCLYLDLCPEHVARPMSRCYPMLQALEFTQSVCVCPYAVDILDGQNRQAKV